VLDFKRVYVDSEPLLAAPWPKFSKPLETALRLCQQFSVEVVLPAPVLEQLEAHWQRDLREALNTAAGSRSRVGRFFARVGLNIPPDHLPSLGRPFRSTGPPLSRFCRLGVFRRRRPQDGQLWNSLPWLLVSGPHSRPKEKTSKMR